MTKASGGRCEAVGVAMLDVGAVLQQVLHQPRIPTTSPNPTIIIIMVIIIIILINIISITTFFYCDFEYIMTIIIFYYNYDSCYCYSYTPLISSAQYFLKWNLYSSMHTTCHERF